MLLLYQKENLKQAKSKKKFSKCIDSFQNGEYYNRERRLRALETLAEPIKISLAAARVNARKTQTQLANEMEISRTTLINLENGKKRISKAQLHLFCELCHIPVANIFLPYKFSE